MKPNVKYLLPIILAVLAFPFVGVVSAQAQSPIYAEVDRTALSTDETLLLTVTLNTNSILNAPRPTLPALPGFNVVGSSSSSQISIVNGGITAQAVYSYRLQPYQTGDLVIDPVSVAVGGRTHNTQPITIRVTQGTGAPASVPPSWQPAVAPAELSGQDLFVEAEVDNPNPYVGEAVVYTFRFYRAVSAWDQPRYEAPSFQGFWAEHQADQAEYRVQVAGRVYSVLEVRNILFPTAAGPETIEPARLVIPGGLFSSGRTLQTEAVDLEVQPLPADAPAGFSGAVGRFTLDAVVDSSQGQVNEPLTWQVTLGGQGNVSTAPDPAWPELPGWRSFESQAAVHTEVREGHVIGSRVYERLLLPSSEGAFTIPALEYVYFDPDTGQYEVVRTESIPVSIAPGDTGAQNYGSADGSLSAEGKEETVEQLATDIRHLKPAPLTLGNSEQPLTRSGLYWAAWVFPLLGATGYFAWQRRQRFWEHHLGLARSSQARKKARKALAQARQQKQDLYSTTGQILTTYLADKLDRPVAGLTHEALADLLAERNIGSDLVERVQVLLVGSELGRFAPGAESPDHAMSLLQETGILIDALEKVL